MHETGVCRDIVETVEMSALRGHAKRVVEVRLKLGEVHDVVPEILSGAFEWMARGTVAEGRQGSSSSACPKRRWRSRAVGPSVEKTLLVQPL